MRLPPRRDSATSRREFDVTRILARLDGDDPATWLPKLRTFAQAFVLILGAEYWARALSKWPQLSPVYEIALATATVACVATGIARLRRAALAALAITQLGVIAAEFPATGNHAYLELYVLLLLSVLRLDEPEERRLLMRALRWLVCLVLFSSGLQKVVHGYYFRGQYLTYSMWIETFRPVLALLVPPGEYARLTSFPSEVGSGPYLVESPLLLLVSNAVWVAELVLPLLLLSPATRVVGVAGTLALLAGIEVAAREVFFGLVFTNGVLLFLPRPLGRWYVPAVAAILAWLLLSALGVVPHVEFH
jgi:hypothetical protein